MVKQALKQLTLPLREQLARYTPIDKGGGLPHALLRSPTAQFVQMVTQKHGQVISAAAGKYELPPTQTNTLKRIMGELTRARFINTNESIKCLTEPLLGLTRATLLSANIPLCTTLLSVLSDQALWVKKNGAVVALFGHSRDASQMALGLRVTVEAYEKGLAITKIQLTHEVSTEVEFSNGLQKAFGAMGLAGAPEAQSKAAVPARAPPGPPGGPNVLVDAGPALLVPPRLQRQKSVGPCPPAQRPTGATRSAQLPADTNVERTALLLLQLSVEA